MFFNKFPYTDFHELNLDWIVKHFKEFLDALAALDEWRDKHEQEYQQLKKLYDQFAVGDLPQSVYDAIHLWVVQNTENIISSAIKMVFFYLDDSGYLVASVPDTWNDIIFHTSGLDIFPTGVDYGHLVLTY